MRLHSFRIKGFKSIIDTDECKLSELDNIVVMAGQNEAGKTAILEALNFFRNGPDKNFYKHQMRQGSENTEVVCTFLISKDDLSYEDMLLDSNKVEDFLKNGGYVSFIRKSTKEKASEIELTEEATALTHSLFAITGSSPEDEKLLADQTAPSPTGEVEQVPPIEPPRFDELINSFTNKLVNSIPPFSLYTSFSDLLPSEILVSELINNKAVQDFEKVFSTSLEKYAQITDHRDRKIKLEALETLATDDFNRSWTQKMTSINDDKKYTFSIEIDNAEPKQIVFMIKGKDGSPLYLEQKSMGFRWFSAFHLRLRSLMENNDKGNIDSNQKDKTRIVLLIDEPGQNLHDVAQVDVKNILEETSGKNIQIIYSTHNPNLIGTKGKEFTRIRLVSNDDKLGTKVENVAQYISKQRGGSLDALSPIRTAMGLVNVQSIFDPNKFNVVVEGITDHYYLSSFQKLLQKDERIHFIPACGVDNVKHLVSVMMGWGCNYKAVFDDDPTQGRKAYDYLKKAFFENDDEMAHEHILKIKNCYGIEDVFSTGDFEAFVLNRKRVKGELKMRNSEIVKNSGKEMHARLFLEKASETGGVGISSLTMNKVEELFTWIYTKFGITEKIKVKS